ncbi:MAG: tetratricopeptide repeat protein [Gemmatimonadota bacterium]|nr:tetratricopeptide repeat protein [Gemmatimonadota bacterium]
MTNPQTPNTTSTPDGRGDALLDWFRIRTRYLVGAGAVVAVAGIGYWFYIRSAQIKSGRAEQSLLQAKQAVVQGNQALAQNDLQNVLRRYGNTRAGVEAGLVLAEIHYGKGEFQRGIDVLRELLDKSAAEPSVAKIHALIGDGEMQLGKPDDAAQSYQRAADQARFDGGRAFYTARKARALMAAGKAAEARKVWEELATAKWAESVALEARVRLGELEVHQARRS